MVAKKDSVTALILLEIVKSIFAADRSELGRRWRLRSRSGGTARRRSQSGWQIWQGCMSETPAAASTRSSSRWWPMTAHSARWYTVPDDVA